MRFSGHVACMKRVRNPFKILIGLFLRSASRLEDNTEAHPTEIRTNSEDVVWNDLVRDIFQWLTFIYKAIRFGILKWSEFLYQLNVCGFPRQPMLRENSWLKRIISLNLQPFLHYYIIAMLIPVAARSKAWVYCRSLAGIVCSNPARGMDVCLDYCVSSGRGLCVGLIARPEESYWMCRLTGCDREASMRRRPWPTSGCCGIKKIVCITTTSSKFTLIRDLYGFIWRLTKCLESHKKYSVTTILVPSSPNI